MSEIKKLIERLCPEGVEYKKLGEVCEKTSKIKWSIANNDANYIYVDLSSVDIQTHKISDDYIITKDTAPSRAQQIIQSGDILFGTTRPTLMRYCRVPVALNGQICSTGFCVIRPMSNLVLSSWIYHLVSSTSFGEFVNERQQGAGYPSISDKVLFTFEIPVPPIEVQSKIVEILDNFTELEAELEARRKQYEYYRNQLLTFDKVGGARFDVKWMTLGEIGEMIKGSGIQKSDFVEDGYPCIHYGQLHTFFGTFADKNKSFISKELYDRCKKAVYGDLIIASTSEDVEACCKATAWLGSEVAISGDAHIFHHNQNPKYVAYFFQTDDFARQKRKYASGVKVVRVSSDNLAKIVIPIPPLEEQNRIVSILDRFEALTTDLQSGLPAEIEARRKQYEYYREKLLTFKRKSA